jgi:uncharacterized membrane protein YgcG
MPRHILDYRKKGSLQTCIMMTVALLFVITLQGNSQPVTAQNAENAPAAWLKLSQLVPDVLVNDFENSLTRDQEKILDSSYNALFTGTAIKMYFVTVDSNTVSKAQFNDLGFHIMQYWFADADTTQYGGIVLVSKELKKIQVFSSKNLDHYISETEMKAVIGNGFIPGYAAGNFFKGSREGTKLLIETLGKNYNSRHRSLR